jgi:hypothetical protein
MTTTKSKSARVQRAPMPYECQLGDQMTKYEPTVCDDFERLMAAGLTVADCADKIGVSESTVKLWRKEHPEFSESLEIGRAKATYHWERKNEAHR